MSICPHCYRSVDLGSVESVSVEGILSKVYFCNTNHLEARVQDLERQFARNPRDYGARAQLDIYKSERDRIRQGYVRPRRSLEERLA